MQKYLMGPLFGINHLIKYGLIVEKDVAKLLLESVIKIGSVKTFNKNIPYIPILLKMGYDLAVINSLVPQQMWSTIITGVLYNVSNLAYSKYIKYSALNNIRSYYEHLFKIDLLTIDSIISKFNIPAYTDPYVDSRHHTITLYRYTSAIELVRDELTDLYSVIDNSAIMKLSKISPDTGLPELYYSSYALPTAELAKRHGIANIYSRAILLRIIYSQQREYTFIYYCGLDSQIGDKKVINRANKQVLYLTDENMQKIVIGMVDPLYSSINFITFAHAFNLFQRSHDVVLSNNRWQFLIKDSAKP